MAEDESLQILVEIVSAMGLVAPYFDEKYTPDAYCVMKLADVEGDHQTLHQTKVCRKSYDPIWTVKTNSLYLFRTSMKDLMASEGLLFQVNHNDMLGAKVFSHGSAKVPSQKIIRSKGKRVEFPLMVKKKRKGKTFDIFQKVRKY